MAFQLMSCTSAKLWCIYSASGHPSQSSILATCQPIGGGGTAPSPGVASPLSIPSEGSISMIVSPGLPTAEPGPETTLPPPVFPPVESPSEPLGVELPVELPLFPVAVLVVVLVLLCVGATYLTTFTVYSTVKPRYVTVMTAVRCKDPLQ